MLVPFFRFLGLGQTSPLRLYVFSNADVAMHWAERHPLSLSGFVSLCLALSLSLSLSLSATSTSICLYLYLYVLVCVYIYMYTYTYVHIMYTESLQRPLRRSCTMPSLTPPVSNSDDGSRGLCRNWCTKLAWTGACSPCRGRFGRVVLSERIRQLMSLCQTQVILREANTAELRNTP